MGHPEKIHAVCRKLHSIFATGLAHVAVTYLCIYFDYMSTTGSLQCIFYIFENVRTYSNIYTKYTNIYEKHEEIHDNHENWRNDK
jgi:hypothetical protein